MEKISFNPPANVRRKLERLAKWQGKSLSACVRDIVADVCAERVTVHKVSADGLKALRTYREKIQQGPRRCNAL